MTYAIIEAGGKQLQVEPGRFYDINLIHADPESKVTFDRVLLIQHGDDIHVGQPVVEGARVEATIMRHLRGRKVLVYKMVPKKKTRKKRGHRQELSRLMIDAIHLNNQALAVADLQLAAQPELATVERSVEVMPDEIATEPTSVVDQVAIDADVTEVPAPEVVEAPLAEPLTEDPQAELKPAAEAD